MTQPWLSRLSVGVLLVDASTTGVSMSPGYGGCPTATPPASYINLRNDQFLHRGLKYYITGAPEFYSTTYGASSHYNDAPRYYSAPSYCTTKAMEDYMTTYAALSYYTEASSCYTEAPAYYSTKTVEYYTEAAKYFSAPIYTTTTEAAKYYKVLTYFTEAALLYNVELPYA